jgi:hypothetical protein
MMACLEDLGSRPLPLGRLAVGSRPLPLVRLAVGRPPFAR